jgi:hypothetical protein
LVLIERWLQAMSILGQMKPETLRKVDTFKIADNYAKRLDIDMSQVVPTETIVKQMEEEAAAQQAAIQQEQNMRQLAEISSAAKDFASAGTIAEQVMM